MTRLEGLKILQVAVDNAALEALVNGDIEYFLRFAALGREIAETIKEFSKEEQKVTDSQKAANESNPNLN